MRVPISPARAASTVAAVLVLIAPHAAGAAQRDCRIRGTVVTPDGAPAPEGTRVWTESYGALNPVALVEEGRFELTVRCKRVAVLVTAPGHAPGPRQPVKVAEGPPLELELQTGPPSPSAYHQGSAVDALGRPLEGVAVYGQCHRTRVLLQITGADGRFRVPQLGERCGLHLVRYDLATRGASLRPRRHQAPDLERLVLTEGFTVRGCVTLDGSPAPAVHVVGIGEWAARRPAQSYGDAPVTGADGCFEVPGVAEGRHEVTVWTREAEAEVTLTVAGRDPPPLRVALVRQATLHVELHSDRGGAIEDGRVHVRNGERNGSTAYREGRYTWTGRPGSLSVKAGATGHAPGTAEIEIGAGETRTVRIVLAAVTPVPVRILTAEGAPAAPGLRVSARMADDFFKSDDAVTDDTGVAVLRELVAGHWVVAAPGVPGAIDVQVPFTDDEAVLDGRAQSIAGRLVTRYGEPVAGAEVCLRMDVDLRGRCRSRVVTEADGRFSLEGVTPGQHTVHARAPNGVEATAIGQTGRTTLEVSLP